MRFSSIPKCLYKDKNYIITHIMSEYKTNIKYYSNRNEVLVYYYDNTYRKLELNGYALDVYNQINSLINNINNIKYIRYYAPFPKENIDYCNSKRYYILSNLYNMILHIIPNAIIKEYRYEKFFNLIIK